MRSSKSERAATLGIKVVYAAVAANPRLLPLASGAEIGEWSTDVKLPDLMYQLLSNCLNMWL